MSSKSGQINFFQATFLGLGALIGAGIFVLIGLAIELAGYNATLVYLGAAVSAFLSALTYAELAATYSNNSGGYGYARDIAGKKIGFITGWLLVTGSIGASAVYAIGFGELSAVFVNWLSVESLAVLATLLVCLVNLTGAERTARAEYYFTLILTIGLLVFGAALFYYSDLSQFQLSLKEGEVLKVFKGISLVYISFFGFQVISASSGEIKNPERTVPNAIITSIIIASLVYLFIVIGLLGVSKGVVSGNPALFLKKMAAETLGSKGAVLIAILGILATLTSLNATFLAVSRRIYNIAKDRYIPELLARVNNRFQTPHLALLLILVLTIILVVFTDLSAVAELSAFCYLASLILIHLVLIISHFKDPNKTRHFVTPLYPLVPIIGIIVNGAAIILLSPLILLLGVGWLFLGMIAWFFLSQKIRGFYKMRLAAGRIKKWLSKDKK